MLTQRRFLLAALSVIAVLGSGGAARATSVGVIASPFTGADTSVHVLLDDSGGNISVTLTVNEGVADLRGFFLNIGDFSLLAGLSVTGDDVTGFVVEDDGVINLKHGVNLNGGGSPCPCDIGVAIGTPGTGKDDVFSTTFVLDADADLTLDAFAGELLGVRVTSVGSGDGDIKDPKDDFKDGPRNGSAKLVGTIPDPIVPVPEPSTALLIALGLGALGYAGRRP
jgi:PEP-CTERM motif-containing protein